MDARRKRDQTVIDLNEFDANQTRALVTIESDLHTMATWISDIEGLFSDGVTAIEFPMEKWMDLTAQNMLKTDLTQYTAEMDGISGMTGENNQSMMMLGTDTDGGKVVMYPQGFGNGPSDLYGTGAYTLPGMASQAIPLRNAGVSGATVLGNSTVITSSGKSVAGKATSAPTTDVKKPEKKKKGNKVLGFLKSAADFLILDDVKTVFDPNASILEKGLAIFSVTPAGKALKAGRFRLKLVQNSPIAKVISKGNSKGTVNNGRKGAFKEAKRDAGIPKGQQPELVRLEPMRTAEYEGGKVIKDKSGKVIYTREYSYSNGNGKKVIIQDHSAGHSTDRVHILM